MLTLQFPPASVLWCSVTWPTLWGKNDRRFLGSIDESLRNWGSGTYYKPHRLL